jgi:hypothetical protein
MEHKKAPDMGAESVPAAQPVADTKDPTQSFALRTATYTDVGAELFLESDQYTPAELEAESAAVRKIIDRRIVPIVRPVS